jgi:hypothetical protein
LQNGRDTQAWEMESVPLQQEAYGIRHLRAPSPPHLISGHCEQDTMGYAEPAVRLRRFCCAQLRVGSVCAGGLHSHSTHRA